MTRSINQLASVYHEYLSVVYSVCVSTHITIYLCVCVLKYINDLMLLLFNSNGVYELKHTCPARVVITKILGPTQMVLKFHP